MEKSKPLAKNGDVAVFLKCTVQSSGKDVPIYNISDGPKDGAKRRCELFGMAGDEIIEPEEALDLYNGYYVERSFSSRNNKTYSGAIVPDGILEKPWAQDGKKGVNRSLQVKIVPYACKQDGTVFGYNVNGILVFKSVGMKSSPVELTPKYAYDLVQHNAQIELPEGHLVNISRIDERAGDNGKIYKTASINVQYAIVSQQEIENDRPAEDQEEPAHKL